MFKTEYILPEEGGVIMSWDLTVYLGNIKNISRKDCEKYLTHFNIQAELYPETNFETDSGFLSIKAEFPSISFLKGKIFLSGFEIYSSAYDYSEELEWSKKLKNSIKKSSEPFGLAREKSNISDEEGEIYNINSEADILLKKCNYSITLCVHSGDSFEPILALAVAAYIAEKCNGVIQDTYSGDSYYKNVRQTISGFIKEEFDKITPDTLLSNPFEGWK